jgi:hypothetical protein
MFFLRYSTSFTSVGCLVASLVIFVMGSSCSTMKKVFAADGTSEDSKPIHNPFGNFHGAEKDKYQNVILRTKKGDKAIEIELPRDDQSVSEFVVPMSPEFINEGRSPASVGGDNPIQVDSTYFTKQPTMTDREITRNFPKGNPEFEWERNQIEQGLGLIPNPDDVPDTDQSYLAGIDKIKQLFILRRYEAALIETDAMVKSYPTDPRLYEMRGTLLSRLGHEDLALKSWEQSVELNPSNESLKKFMNRRRSISSVPSRRGVQSPQ